MVNERWTDERGHEHGICVCGSDCSTHPDAGNPLDSCADCGIATCPDCRVYSRNAPVCLTCSSKREVSDVAELVLCRMDSKSETFDVAFEAVTGGFDRVLACKVGANLRGER